MVLHGGSSVSEGWTSAGNYAQSSTAGQPSQPHVLALPSRWKGNQQAGAGLNNLGNSCYLNSTLQCLAYVPPLAHLCLTRGHSSTCCRGIAGPAPAAPCAFCLIERQVSALLRSPRGASVSPGEVVRHLHLFSRTFVKGRQEDSHELLTAILDVMERDGRRAAVALGAPKGCRTVVEDLFLGRWQSQVRCLRCGHESNTYESFATLPLDIGQARTVLDGLRAFTEEERLDGNNKYRCDSCRQLVPAIKQTTIWDEPNVLVVHLKRFDAGSLLGKITRHVAFPETVDLQPFMTAPEVRRRAEMQHLKHHPQQQQRSYPHPRQHQHQHGANGLAGNPHPDNDPALDGNGLHHHHHDSELELRTSADGAGTGPGSPTASCGPGGGPGGVGGCSAYSLTGVLVHQGSSLHSGHYYAFVRDANDRWSCMNDSQVYGTSLEQVRQEQAYLLFYTRQSMKLPRPTPGPTPTPVPAAASDVASAHSSWEAGTSSGPQPPGVRQVYGPQLPPHLVARRSLSSDDVGPEPGPAPAASAGSARPGAGPGVPTAAAAAASGLPVRATYRPPSAAASMARLSAKVVISPKKQPQPAGPTVLRHDSVAAAANGERRGSLSGAEQEQQQRSPAGGAGEQAGASLPARAASCDGSATALVASPTAGVMGQGHDRKRKRDEAAVVAEAVTAATPSATPLNPADRLRAAVDAEAAALQAGSSWTHSVKRLKGDMKARLRETEWLARLRSTIRSMQQAGMSLQEVLACSRADPRRQGLARAVPHAVLQYGMAELQGMLRTLLLSLGWLGGLMLL